MPRSFELPEEFYPRLVVVVALVFSFALGSKHVLANEDMPTVEQDFQFHCAACHGADGKGDGPVARVLKIQPPDLTRIAERNGGVFPEAVIFGTISGLDMPVSHGTREMPLWGDLFIGETLAGSTSIEEAQEATAEVTQRIRRLVKYIATIQVTK